MVIARVIGSLIFISIAAFCQPADLHLLWRWRRWQTGLANLQPRLQDESKEAGTRAKVIGKLKYARRQETAIFTTRPHPAFGPTSARAATFLPWLLRDKHKRAETSVAATVESCRNSLGFSDWPNGGRTAACVGDTDCGGWPVGFAGGTESTSPRCIMAQKCACRYLTLCHDTLLCMEVCPNQLFTRQ